MTTRGNQWQERQEMAGEQGGQIRINSSKVRHIGRGQYEVIIRGNGLHGAITPPRVMVGGKLVKELEFEHDGRVIRGVLQERPESQKVTVDYGFTSAEKEK